MTDMTDTPEIETERPLNPYARDFKMDLLSVALEALSTRLLTLLSLFFSAGMFVFAIIKGEWISLLAAAIFSVAAWFIVKVTPHKG